MHLFLQKVTENTIFLAKCLAESEIFSNFATKLLSLGRRVRFFAYICVKAHVAQLSDL